MQMEYSSFTPNHIVAYFFQPLFFHVQSYTHFLEGVVKSWLRKC